MTMMKDTSHSDYYRIERAIRYLEENFKRQPELEEVAEQIHVSPFHFQRMFTEWAGISPIRFLQFLTTEFLKEKLAAYNIHEASELAGLSSQSRVYDLFTTLEAVTPQEYRLHGKGISICYGIHTTPFGLALIGVTERGICWLSFLSTDDPKSAIEEMRTHWFNSTLIEDQSLTTAFVKQMFGAEHNGKKLHVFVKGTNFQVKVWEALLRLPPGHLTTYQNLAQQIDNPKAVQAVGSAVGANHIGYLIPCHRVIRKDGVLGEYRWNSARKKSMVGWELASSTKTETD